MAGLVCQNDDSTYPYIHTYIHTYIQTYTHIIQQVPPTPQYPTKFVNMKLVKSIIAVVTPVILV